MSTDKTADKIKLTVSQAVIFADSVCGIPATKTAEKLGINRATVAKHRKRINKFVNHKFDVDKFRHRMLGLLPLAIESLAYHLANRDIDVTIKFLQGTGLLAKDYEEFKELMQNVASAGRSDTHVHLTMGDGNGNGNGNGTGKFGRFAEIYTAADKHSRLNPIDN